MRLMLSWRSAPRLPRVIVSTDKISIMCAQPVNCWVEASGAESTLPHRRISPAKPAALTLDIIKPLTGVGAPS